MASSTGLAEAGLGREEKPQAGKCRTCGATVEPLELKSHGRTLWIEGDECELCARRREKAREARDAEERMARLLKESNLPAEAEDWDFEKAAAEAPKIKSGEDLELWQRAHYFCRTWPATHRKGLYIVGPTGTGKSVLGYCLVKAAIAEGRRAAFVSVSEMFEAMRRKYAKDQRGEDLARLAEEADVLVLDDIGVEEPKGLLAATLLRIIDKRIGAKRKTHYTTNCTPQQLDAVLSASDEHHRTVSRIIGSTKGLELKGEDFRTAGGKDGWLL